MENEILVVEGMTCEKCAAAIDEALLNVPGVSAVEADYSAGTVDVCYDASLVNRDAIAAAIESQGFVVVA